MLSILTQTLRLVGRRWPQLMAWFLVGWLARTLLIELAAQVGATFSLGGYLILPLAILARLISFVAMFLVLRDDLPNLRRAAADPLPSSRPERRAAFLDAVFVSILPFFAFYYAWGLLRDDYREYAARAIDIYSTLRVEGDFFSTVRPSYTEIDTLHFDALTVSIIVIAFAGRWALKRWRGSIPRWTALVGVYLEAVWVFMSVLLISGLIGSVSDWVAGRQAMVWLADARAWLAGFSAPLAWIWDGITWVLGEVGGVVLQPLAWLAIAGVVYGRAIAARTVALPAHERVDAVRRRYSSLPARLRRRLREVGDEITARFRPVWRAVLLIWHAGAIPMGLFVFGYTVVVALQGWLRWGVNTLIGPQSVTEFWFVYDPVVILVVVAVTEPVRIALVAAAYDHALAKLSPSEREKLEEPVTDASGGVTAPTAEGPVPAPRSEESPPSSRP